MRIGIDATCWNNWRGFGRFTRCLISALLEVDPANEYVLFFDSSYHACRDVPNGGRIVVVPTSAAQSEAIGAASRRTLADVWRMARAVSRHRLDLFYCPSIDSYFPVLDRARMIVTIHDLIPELHPELTSLSRRALLIRRLKVRLALWQAGFVVTGSEYTRGQICHHFGLRPERVGVVPYGAAAIFRPPCSREAVQSAARARYGLLSSYLLVVSGFGPHKNLAALVDAFAVLARLPEFSSLALVVVGKPEGQGPDSGAALESAIERGGVASRVHSLGFVSDEELAALYQGAEAVVLPALKEGFGLPAIEAVACGTPVVATCESPLPEALGDAAVTIDPNAPDQLARTLKAVLGDAARLEGLRRAALERSGQFSWQRSAEMALEIFAEQARRV